MSDADSVVGSHLLVSDVDNTILGDDVALAALADWYASRRDRLRLVYSSGRFFESVCESIATTRMPEPAAIIGGVGTHIRLYPEGAEIDAWTARFADWDADIVRATLADRPELELQPEHLLSPHKVSYYAYSAPPELLAELEAQLAAAGQQVRIVYSSQRDLDVLPAAAGKGAAARFLAEYWNIPPANVLVAGDSGNDEAMFGEGFSGIVVANAHPELKALRGDHIFHAPRAYAFGVLDGLTHWLNGELGDV